MVKVFSELHLKRALSDDIFESLIRIRKHLVDELMHFQVLYKVVLMAAANVVALFGNTLVCLSVYRDTRLRSKIGTVILALAVTDLFTAFTVMPLTTTSIAFTGKNNTFWQKWISQDGNKVFCYLQGTLIYALTDLSVCVMAFTAFIRYLCVAKPNIYHRYITTKAIFIFVGVVNLLIFAMEILVLVSGYAQVRFVSQFNLCMIFFLPQFEQMRLVALYLFAAFIIFPVLVSFGCYTLIFFTVKKHTRTIRTQVSISRQQNLHSKKHPMKNNGESRAQKEKRPSRSDKELRQLTVQNMEKEQQYDIGRMEINASGYRPIVRLQHGNTPYIDLPPDVNTEVSNNNLKRVSKEKTQAKEEKVTKTLLAVFLGFICCWIPPVVLAAVMEASHSYRDYGIVITFSVALSSAVNPFIYGASDRRFRKTYKKLLTCK